MNSLIILNKISQFENSHFLSKIQFLRKLIKTENFIMEKEDSKESITGQQLKPYKGAKVLWPLECPYNILDNVIEKATELLSEFDIDTDGL